MPNRPPLETSLDEQRLAECVSAANLPSLLMVLYQLTGDRKWITDPFLPTRPAPFDDNDSGGFSEDLQEEVRDAAVQAIKAWSCGSAPAVPAPDTELFAQMMSISVGEDVATEYVSMLAAQAGFSAAQAGFSSVGSPHSSTGSHNLPEDFSVLIIGAGFGGITVGIKLREANIPFTIVERRDRVGGVWLQNRYPGAGVDVPSFLYSYSFFPRPWDRYYARRDALVSYIEEAVQHYGLDDSIRFGLEVTSARYDELTQRWTVTMTDNAGREVTQQANAVISAVGIFSQPKTPDIPGMDMFSGEMFHSASWPEGLDLTDKRVALVGTGASAMQILPAIADRAASVTVFQRTSAWITPANKYFDYVDDRVRWLMENVPYYLQWYRLRLCWAMNEKAHASQLIDPDWPHPERSVNATNERLRKFCLAYMRNELADRPDLQAKCEPNYPPWGKRMLIDNGWFKALTRHDVELIDDPVESISETSVISQHGQVREVDIIVWCTGFEAQRFLYPMDIRGRGGQSLREVWNDDDARAYLGLTVAGFPNLFMVYGPNTNGGGGSYLTLAESQVNYIVSLIDLLSQGEIGAVEPRQDVQDDYNQRMDEAHNHLVWTHPGVQTYYRNRHGHVVVNMPWRGIEYWNLTQQPLLDEYLLEPVLTESKVAGSELAPATAQGT